MSDLKPSHLGIEEYLTLDATSNLLQIFKENNTKQSEVISFEKQTEPDWEIINSEGEEVK